MDANVDIAESASAYCVDEVLKRGDAEVTELVYFQGMDGGELGPFVRKRIARASGLGAAYETLFRAQRDGRRFKHLPRVVDLRACGDELHVVMEYVYGETLDAFVGHQGASAGLACRLVPAVCEAVSELHMGFPAPIIHRDIKPSNIMVAEDTDGRLEVTLIDLGIARTWHEGAEADTTHLGTRSYAPPEQFGFGQTDVRSDVYALGMLLIFCCTGLQPQAGMDADVLRRAGIPDPLAKIVLRATAFDPVARYGDAQGLASAIRCAGAAVEKLAAKDGAGARVPSPAARVVKVLGIVWNTALCLALALLVIGSVYAVLYPTGEGALLPRWFIVLEMLSVVDVPVAMAAYALLYGRRPTMGRLRLLALAFGVGASSLILVSLVGGWLGLL